MTLALLFLFGLLISAATSVLALLTLARSRRREFIASRMRPDLLRMQHSAVENPNTFLPGVSIVKPLSGPDDELEENLESFFLLDFPEYEIVFSLAREADPAFPIARRVADRHPNIPSVFVVDPRERGANSKVNRLDAGVRRARHRFLLFSDGNVRVRKDFLRRAIAPFRDPRVGLLSHLFRGTRARSLGSRLECLHLNGYLQAGTAALARLLGMPCVVGKSILVSRQAFDEIGGFASIRDCLAEDFLLGRAVHQAGFRVLLSTDVVDTVEVSRSLSAVWARHRRWAMMRRRLAGPAYAVELFASPLPHFAGAVLFSTGLPALLPAAVALLLIRYAAEAIAAAESSHPLRLSEFAILPLRDAVVAGIFWAGLIGRSTVWRGRRVAVGRHTMIAGTGAGRLPAKAIRQSPSSA